MYRFSQFYLHFVDYNLLVLFVTCRLPVKAQLPFSYFCSRLGCPNLTEASLFVLGLHATSGASSHNIFPYYNMTRMETQNKKDNNEAFFLIVWRGVIFIDSCLAWGISKVNRTLLLEETGNFREELLLLNNKVKLVDPSAGSATKFSNATGCPVDTADCSVWAVAFAWLLWWHTAALEAESELQTTVTRAVNKMQLDLLVPLLDLPPHPAQPNIKLPIGDKVMQVLSGDQGKHVKPQKQTI